jgi:hypothetical protein
LYTSGIARITALKINEGGIRRQQAGVGNDEAIAPKLVDEQVLYTSGIRRITALKINESGISRQQAGRW